MKAELILCPVDFSMGAEMAIALAAKIARPETSRVILLNVIEPGSESDRPTSLVGAMIHDARERMRDQELTDRSIPVEHLTLKGKPGEVIVHFAEKKKVDMIVMGTHGRTGLSKLLAGSVAQDVMRRAPCPVITVKPPLEGNE